MIKKFTLDYWEGIFQKYFIRADVSKPLDYNNSKNVL